MGGANRTPEEISYRDQRADERLDHHDVRITRMEKFGYVLVGYLLAENALGNGLTSQLIGLI